LNNSSSPALTVREAQLTLDDVQTLLDFGLIRGRAIAAEQEFDDVSRAPETDD
jgi:hypothetical protein